MATDLFEYGFEKLCTRTQTIRMFLVLKHTALHVLGFTSTSQVVPL